MQVDPFTKFEKDWALLTAGTEGRYNSMTIGWGSLGTVWNKDVLTVYVRPDRYTWEFLKENDTFTVSFFPESCREALLLMGRLSGRDGDKAAAAGLTPRSLPEGATRAARIRSSSVTVNTCAYRESGRMPRYRTGGVSLSANASTVSSGSSESSHKTQFGSL